jgi:fluoride exporter
MPVVLAVALGGALGAVARYGADSALTMHSTFPWSTFVVNIVGCFLIGLFSESLADSPDWLRTGMIVGLVGGFTTFSTFAYQALENHATLAAGYVGLSVTLGIAAVAAGRAI